MNIEQGKYQLTLTRAELIALNRALLELQTMQQKYPNERSGYDLNTSSLAKQIHWEIAAALKDDAG